MENKKDKLSRKTLFWIIGVSILVIAVLIVSFYLFFSSQKETDAKILDSGLISMTYTDESNEFSLVNAVPMTNEVGMKLDGADQYFDFSVATQIKDSKRIQYEISVTKSAQQSTILDKNIRIYLEKQDSGSYIQKFASAEYKALKEKTKIGTPKDSMVLTTVNKKTDDIDNYRLRMWLASDSLVTPEVLQNYTVEVNVYGKAE